MNPGLMGQVQIAKDYYRVANPKAKHITVRKISGPQFVEPGHWDNADLIIDLEYSTHPDPEMRFYFYWATIGVLDGQYSVWID